MLQFAGQTRATGIASSIILTSRCFKAVEYSETVSAETIKAGRSNSFSLVFVSESCFSLFICLPKTKESGGASAFALLRRDKSAFAENPAIEMAGLTYGGQEAPRYDYWIYYPETIFSAIAKILLFAPVETLEQTASLHYHIV